MYWSMIESLLYVTASRLDVMFSVSMCASVRFINLGSLEDRLPRQGLAQAGSTQLMGWPKSLKTTGWKSGPVTDQKV